MSVLSTRIIYLSSEQNSSGDSRILNYNISSQLINYPTNSRLKLILNTFCCPKTWYTLNQYNGIFYLGNKSTNELFEAQIPSGNYTSLDTLKPILQTLIQDILTTNFSYTGTTTVNYEDISGHFFIILSEAVPDLILCCFSVQGDYNVVENSPLENALNSISLAGKYNDVDQILGGTTNRSVAGLSTVSQLEPLFTIVPPTTTNFRSKYPANLQTNDALYLRVSSLPTGSIESTNLSLNFSVNQLISSDIFAKILLPTDLTRKFIDFIDPNDNFVMEIQASQLTNIRIALTDDKGRLIPLVAPTQAFDGSIKYSLSIKVNEIN